MKYKRLGDLLIGAGLLTEEQLSDALVKQKEAKKRLGEFLISERIITEQQLIDVLKMQLGLDYVDVTNINIPNNVTSLISRNFAKKYNVLPIAQELDKLYLATADPLDFVAIEDIRKSTRMKVIPVISTKDAIERAVMRIYDNESSSKALDEMLEETNKQEVTKPKRFSLTGNKQQEEIVDEGNAPTVRFVNSIIERAVVEKASDIHIEPTNGSLVVRMRIDGVLRNILTVPKELQSSVISRIKVMGNMDIAEKRIPQDGRAEVVFNGQDIDMRLSTLPTVHGEKVVIRLHFKGALILDPEHIGLTGKDLEKFNELLTCKSGVILIVGPTGSGKSSTMSTMINILNREEVNITTLEDPVEYQIPGVNQVQINEKQGMTFASGLRSILRQDPDIIEVGEIRDTETAEIAMRSAITGHLVLSTIHTSNALATIDRLLDMGIEPYLIGGAMRGIIAQRLVRRICIDCKTSYTPDETEVESLNLPKKATDYVFYKGKGCNKCGGTGYKGRIAVFEILNLDSKLRSEINAGNKKDGLHPTDFITITDNCARLVQEGLTTVEEAISAIDSSNL